MSESESNPANEPDTTEEPSGNEASWEEAISHDRQLKSQRKTIQIAFPEEPDQFVEFEYRMLTESEEDEAEDAATNIETSRNKTEITTDSGALRATVIKNGVTDGPEGFKATESYIQQMPNWIKKPLANAIEDFTSMDEVTREGF